MSVKWTNDQLSAIEEVEKGVVVSAAAGSGKTAVLIERTIRILADETKKITADKLLAVTFTNDAAGQMRDKLTDALAKKIDENPSNIWLSNQLINLQSAKISTISSFCFDIVKNNIHQFDLEDGVRIIDDSEESIIISEVIDEVFEYMYVNRPKDMDFLIDLFCGKSDDKNLAEILRITNKFTNQLTNKDVWYEESIERFNEESPHRKKIVEDVAKEHIKDIEQAIDILKECRKRAIDQLKLFDSVKSIIESDIEVLCDLKDLLIENKIQEVSELSKKFKTFSRKENKSIKLSAEDIEIEEGICGKINKSRTGPRELFNATIKFYKDLVLTQQELRKNSKSAFEILVFMNDLLDEYIWNKKQQKNAVSFSDVERMTLNLLCSYDKELKKYVRTDLAQEIIEKGLYQVVLIDEYQDVNNLQDLIFKTLSNTDDLNEIGSNMFIVGDIKQSIYAFRGSNPDIFSHVRKVAASKDKEKMREIILSTNFRSRQNVIDFVNFTFENLMTESNGGVNYNEQERLDFGAKYYNEREELTEIIIVNNINEIVKDEDDDKEKYTDEISPEILAVVEKIASMLKEGYKVFDNGVDRRCRPSDFCILMRTKAQFKAIIKAFDKFGIQSVTEELDGYLKSREISILINMLKVIDNPMNDIALAGVLLSPIFMVSPDELAMIKCEANEISKKIKGKNNRKIYQTILDISKRDKFSDDTFDSLFISKMQNIIKTISEFRFYSASYSTSKLIKKIYDKTNFFIYASVYNDAQQKRANLRLLLEYANAHDVNFGSGVSGFIRYIDGVMRNDKDFKQAVLVTDMANSISIKTIHKSKGLEYPFIFLCGISGGFNMRDFSSNILLSEDLGVSFKLQDSNKLIKYKTIDFINMVNKGKQNLKSEQLRLMYVAMTRAKEKLFIILNRSVKIDAAISKLVEKIKVKGELTPEIAESCNSMQEWLISRLIFHPQFDGKYIAQDLNGLKSNTTSSKICVSEFTSGTITTEIDEKVEVNFEPNAKIIEEIKKSVDFKYDFSLAKTSSKLSVTEISKDTQETMFYPRLNAFNDEIIKLSPAEKGTATHNFLEMADMDLAKQDVVSEITRLQKNGLLTKKQAEIIDVDSIETFFKSNMYTRMSNSPNVMKEKKFMIMISDLDVDYENIKDYAGTDGMLQGIADCIFEESDGYVLVDYKTDNVKTTDELIEKYKMQLNLYRATFDLLLDKPVKSAYIYSFCLAKDIEISF